MQEGVGFDLALAQAKLSTIGELLVQSGDSVKLSKKLLRVSIVQREEEGESAQCLLEQACWKLNAVEQGCDFLRDVAGNRRVAEIPVRAQ